MHPATLQLSDIFKRWNHVSAKLFEVQTHTISSSVEGVKGRSEGIGARRGREAAPKCKFEKGTNANFTLKSQIKTKR